MNTHFHIVFRVLFMLLSNNFSASCITIPYISVYIARVCVYIYNYIFLYIFRFCHVYNILFSCFVISHLCLFVFFILVIFQLLLA